MYTNENCPGHPELAFNGDRTWCETCGVTLVATDLGLRGKPVSLAKPVNLVKRRTLRADDLVRHGIPTGYAGKRRRLIAAR